MAPIVISRPKVSASILIATLIAASVWLTPLGAAGADLPPLRSAAAPFFSADVAVTIDSTTHAAVSVTVTVPYTELNWRRAAQGYGAGAGFSVELQPSKGNRLYGDAWEQRLLMPDYASASSPQNNLSATRAFDVPPGRYHVRVRVRDVNSEQESRAQDDVRVEDLASVPLGFADLQLGVLDSLGRFVTLPTRRFGYNASDIAARAVLFDRRPGAWPRSEHFRFRIVDDSGNPLLTGDTLVALARSADAVTIHPNHPEIFIGTYLFELELVEGKSRWRTSRSFDVEESGPPRGKQFDQMLEGLAYVADAAEVDAMRGRSPDEQAAAWEGFWKRRDPTPETARNEYQLEFFRRLRYADQHFQGFGPGWRSDMGRIYIHYGPPDQIEQRAATASSPQYELWYYNQPYRRFVFADRDGFGRYSLISPSIE
ncbi:MAG: GWxTD domain-containing protein [Candidatus Eisenbacteria bacterium]